MALSHFTYDCIPYKACANTTSRQGHIMGAKMERDMRKQLFEHYEKLSFSYYSTHNSGQIDE